MTPIERTAVHAMLRRFDGMRFHLNALVVMDDHVHVIVRPSADETLEKIVQGWKAFSARRLCEGGRTAPIWQRGYYDHVIRSCRDLAVKINYVRLNPVRRWPDLFDYSWVWVSNDP